MFQHFFSIVKVFLLVLAFSWLPINIPAASAQDYSELVKAIIQAGNDITEAGTAVSRSIDGLNQTISINAATLLKLITQYAPSYEHSFAQIGNFSASAQGLMESSSAQITVYIVGGILTTAAVFYIGDCIVRIGKAIYGWCHPPKKRALIEPLFLGYSD